MEAAVATLKYGFDVLHLQKIMAFALPQNLASVRILEKLGAVYLHEFVLANLAHRLYDLPRSKLIEADQLPKRQIVCE